MAKLKDITPTLREKALAGKMPKLGHNTHLVKTDGGVGVRLHGTVVVDFLDSGDIVLDSGGFETRTTKDRINRYCPIGVYQHQYEWFLNTTNKRPFVRGMIVRKEEMQQ
jgi:hypothetical protein